MRLSSWLTRAALGAALALGLAGGAATAQTEAPGAALADLLRAERAALSALPAGALREGRPRPAAATARRDGAPGIDYSLAWLSAQPAPAGGADWECLAKGIYFEARGETLEGQFAVAEVILNRVDSPLFPASVCAVVRQSGGGGCQFSWVCDGRSDRVREGQAWQTAGRIAAVMLAGAPRGLTQGATYFHSRAVRPSWSRSFRRTAVIGAHFFYRDPGADAAVTLSAMD